MNEQRERALSWLFGDLEVDQLLSNARAFIICWENVNVFPFQISLNLYFHASTAFLYQGG